MNNKIPSLLFAVISLFSISTVQAAIYNFSFALEGSQEVSNGDPDGFGTAMLTIDDSALTVDWLFTVNNISENITGAHIHIGQAGVNGPVVVNFSGALTGSGLVDADLAGVLADPTNYYVNIHTDEHTGGAIRGQLPPVPVPAAAYLMGSALLSLVAIRRRFAKT